MSLFEKYTKAWNEKDISAFVECHHDDYEFVIPVSYTHLRAHET